MEPYKEFYSLTEVMEDTGLPAATLRYWESRFPQLQPRKDGHGNRYYRLADINLIKRIRFIRDEMKITRIEAIQKELAGDEHQAERRQRTVEILQRIKQQLIHLKASI
ncbi:MAG: MerR family transcriptional regulator [Paludibacteraceae bacterium]|nr:MerR family transcriptional regulator [Paludibacteraceae bacterium]